MNAKEKSEEADRIEKLKLMVTDYVSDVGTMESLPTFLKSREGKEIDKAVQIPYPSGSTTRVNVVQMGEYYYMITEEENGQINIERLDINTDLENIEGGITLATPENFDKEKNGTMTFNPGEGEESTLVFSDVINDEFCFDIRSGNVTIYIDNNMTLTNKDAKDPDGNKRSAINIEPNATLNLYIAKGVTLTVDSGFGEEGEKATGWNAKGGPGGFAGIRVPWIDSDNDRERDLKEQAELNLYGEGTVIAIGGNAGNGNGSMGVGDSNTGGGGRWWCWSWNWWKPEEKVETQIMK